MSPHLKPSGRNRSAARFVVLADDNALFFGKQQNCRALLRVHEEGAFLGKSCMPRLPAQEPGYEVCRPGITPALSASYGTAVQESRNGFVCGKSRAVFIRPLAC